MNLSSPLTVSYNRSKKPLLRQKDDYTILYTILYCNCLTILITPPVTDPVECPYLRRVLGENVTELAYFPLVYCLGSRAENNGQQVAGHDDRRNIS